VKYAGVRAALPTSVQESMKPSTLEQKASMMKGIEQDIIYLSLLVSMHTFWSSD
jgi:hypothetical protein